MLDGFFAYLYQSFSPALVNWVILPILIFFARILDVSLGTLRIIFVAKGKQMIAPILGFFEVLCWVLVASQLIRSITSIGPYLGYAAGFAFGTYAGMRIENKLALGMVLVRVIVAQGGEEMARQLHENNLGVTTVDALGATGSVKLLYSVIQRRDLEQLQTIIARVNPEAFVSVEAVNEARSGIFPAHNARERTILRMGK